MIQLSPTGSDLLQKFKFISQGTAIESPYNPAGISNGRIMAYRETIAEADPFDIPGGPEYGPEYGPSPGYGPLPGLEMSPEPGIMRPEATIVSMSSQDQLIVAAFCIAAGYVLAKHIL